MPSTLTLVQHKLECCHLCRDSSCEGGCVYIRYEAAARRVCFVAWNPLVGGSWQYRIQLLCNSGKTFCCYTILFGVACICGTTVQSKLCCEYERICPAHAPLAAQLCTDTHTKHCLLVWPNRERSSFSSEHEENEGRRWSRSVTSVILYLRCVGAEASSPCPKVLKPHTSRAQTGSC